MATKLTLPQRELLGDLRRRSPMRVVAGYKPASRLSALGFSTIEVVDETFGWKVEITEAGIAEHAAITAAT